MKITFLEELFSYCSNCENFFGLVVVHGQGTSLVVGHVLLVLSRFLLLTTSQDSPEVLNLDLFLIFVKLEDFRIA